METFYNDFGFIIGFMVLSLLVLLAFGAKAEKWFLLMILFSMILIKSDAVVKFMDTHFKLERKA